MISNHRNLIAVSTFLLLAGCFVVIAQDTSAVPTNGQEIGILKQEVIDLQNRIQVLKNEAANQPLNELPAPQPGSELQNPLKLNGPDTNSVYPSTSSTQTPSPAGPLPQIGSAFQAGYSPVAPIQPWGVEQAVLVGPMAVEHYVPVQVPVYVEAPPCRVDYVPVCDYILPPAIGFQFSFGGHTKHHKHKKHKH